MVGYVVIKKSQTSGKGNSVPIEEFLEIPLRVMDWDSCTKEGKQRGALVLNPKGTSLCMFDGEDVSAAFVCDEVSGILCESGLNMFEQMAYISKASLRKGGYGPIVKAMVVASSLHKGEFNDRVLWAKQ